MFIINEKHDSESFMLLRLIVLRYMLVNLKNCPFRKNWPLTFHEWVKYWPNYENAPQITSTRGENPLFFPLSSTTISFETLGGSYQPSPLDIREKRRARSRTMVMQSKIRSIVGVRTGWLDWLNAKMIALQSSHRWMVCVYMYKHILTQFLDAVVLGFSVKLRQLPSSVRQRYTAIPQIVEHSAEMFTAPVH